MPNIQDDPTLVAFCGLYCGACGKFIAGTCPGCAKNEKATWCKTRACNLEHAYASCADCQEFADPKQCKKFHNPISRFFGLIFRSDRPACIARIKKIGRDAYAKEMADTGRQSIRRK